ncbi:sensor histidine kinase [Streptosporangium sp. V21-05]|uniref:sensor histidine kinase n=1 Tax=Streptosporangium sp. V21-05 TaxID=3446115 RepID=UPI003F52F188
MTMIRRPRSIRGRCAAATSLLALIALALLGASVCLCVRHALGSDAYPRAGRVTAPGVPGLLQEHGLECLIVVLVPILTAGAGLATWWVLGRALRSVQAIRAHLEKVTVNDLGRRMRVPPGDDEIAELARTTNQTLARLDEAVTRQRRFVATTSHELRDPITGLRAELEDALDHPEDTDPRRTLRTALTIADRLDTIVTDLLAQARTDAAGTTGTTGTAPGHELIDLTELVTQEAARTNRTRPRTGGRDGDAVDAECAADADRPNGAHADGSSGARAGGVPRDIPVRLRTGGDVRVCGSRVQVVRALANLLGNARRHAVAAADLTLTTAHGQAVIAVTDDGPEARAANDSRRSVTLN